MWTLSWKVLQCSDMGVLTEVGGLRVDPVVEGVVEVLHDLGHLVGGGRVGGADAALHARLGRRHSGLPSD